MKKGRLKTSQIGTKKHETRATFIVNEIQLESIKALAHWERISIKEVIAEAIASHLASKRCDFLNKMKEKSVSTADLDMWDKLGKRPS